MEKLPFSALFLRYYDRKIMDGTVTFSKVGISKDDFTNLCTDKDYVPDKKTVERVCITLKLTAEEADMLKEASGYDNECDE